MRPQVAEVTTPMDQDRITGAQRLRQIRLEVILDVAGIRDGDATIAQVRALAEPYRRVAHIRVRRKINQRTAASQRDQAVENLQMARRNRSIRAVLDSASCASGLVCDATRWLWPTPDGDIVPGTRDGHQLIARLEPMHDEARMQHGGLVLRGAPPS
jgi:hypothetical protein